MTALVLGAGVGGLTVARRLRRLLPPPWRVMLVERRRGHLFPPLLLRVALGLARPEEAVRDLTWLSRAGIELIRDRVLALDPEKRTAILEGREERAELLVVALGAERTLMGVPGLAEAAHEFYSLRGARRLWRALAGFGGGRVAVLVAGEPYSCPTAPYELALLLAERFRRRRLEAKVSVFTPEPHPLPAAGPEAGAHLAELLAARGIRLRCGVRAAAVEAKGLLLSDGTRAGFDLLVAVPFHRPAAAVRRSALAGPHGWVPVDGATLATRFAGVYALGDVAAITLPGRHLGGRPLELPKAGVLAHRQAVAVARLLDRWARGRPAEKGFDGRGVCLLETGGGRAVFGGGDFYARPAPALTLREPSRWWHWGKALFERTWLGWANGRRAASLALEAGTALLDVALGAGGGNRGGLREKTVLGE